MTEDELLHLARIHATLGLPLGRTRFRFLKRVLLRLTWLTNSHQVAFNDYVLQVVERVRGDASRIRLEVMQEIGVVRSEVAAFSELDAERGAALGAALARLDVLLESMRVIEAGARSDAADVTTDATT